MQALDEVACDALRIELQYVSDLEFVHDPGSAEVGGGGACGGARSAGMWLSKVTLFDGKPAWTTSPGAPSVSSETAARRGTERPVIKRGLVTAGFLSSTGTFDTDSTTMSDVVPGGPSGVR